MNHPDLYLLLFLLAGLATFMVIIFECIQKFCRRKPPVVLPLDGLQRDRAARTEERASQRPSDFDRLCESVKDLPPKEQASRVREYFGIVGGARPAEGRRRNSLGFAIERALVEVHSPARPAWLPG